MGTADIAAENKSETEASITYDIVKFLLQA